MQDHPAIKVKISENGLAAVVEEVPAWEGSTKGRGKLLEAALTRAGVTRGLDKEAVRQVYSLLMAGSPVPETVVARGRPPRPGQDGRIEYLVSLEREAIGTRDGRGHIDFREKGNLPQVQEGQELARLIPPRPGEPGFTVTSKIIRPDKTKPARLSAGKYVTRQGDTFVAQRQGLLIELEPGKLSVLEVLDLKNVDNETGHVEFSGLVRVAGGVAAGFKVKAGALEAANLEAEAVVEVDETVTVDGPILGVELKAGGTIQCAIVRKSEIECGGDLLVANEIVDSTIKVQGSIKLLSPEGRIVNCDLTVGRGLETGRLLSKGKSPSRVTLGLKGDSGMDREVKLEELSGSRNKLVKDLARMEAEIRVWGREWHESRAPDLAQRIRRKGEELKDLRNRLEEITTRLKEAERAAAREEAGRAYLSVRHSADAGLTITGQRASLVLDRPVQAFSARELFRTDPETGKDGWAIAILDPNISP